MVLACSALRRLCRDLLRERVGRIGFVFLDPPREAVEERVRTRESHFMPAALLRSRIDTLEPPGADENAVRIAMSGHHERALEAALRGIAAREGAG